MQGQEASCLLSLLNSCLYAGAAGTRLHGTPIILLPDRAQQSNIRMQTSDGPHALDKFSSSFCAKQLAQIANIP